MNNLKQENEFLKQAIKVHLETNEELQQRINKATEYINQLPFNDLVPLEVKVIKKILQGEDK